MPTNADAPRETVTSAAASARYRSRSAGIGAVLPVTLSNRRLAAELERLLQHPFDGRPLRVSWRTQGDEPHLLSAPLEQSTPVVELAATVEEQGRVARECADANHVAIVDGVADELPHVSAGSWGRAPITDLLGTWRGGLHHSARRLHRGAHRRRDFLQLFGNGDLDRARHHLGLYQLRACAG